MGTGKLSGAWGVPTYKKKGLLSGSAIHEAAVNKLVQDVLLEGAKGVLGSAGLIHDSIVVDSTTASGLPAPEPLTMEALKVTVESIKTTAALQITAPIPLTLAGVKTEPLKWKFEKMILDMGHPVFKTVELEEPLPGVSMGGLDRSSWLHGEWDHEPEDRVEWFEEGFPCVLARGALGSWTGFIAVPEGHPWFSSVPSFTDVHGGITLANPITGGGLILPPRPRDKRAWVEWRNRHGWAVGFDCGHHGDLHPSLDFAPIGAVYRTTQYALKEVRKLVALAKQGLVEPVTTMGDAEIAAAILDNAHPTIPGILGSWHLTASGGYIREWEGGPLAAEITENAGQGLLWMAKVWAPGEMGTFIHCLHFTQALQFCNTQLLPMVAKIKAAQKPTLSEWKKSLNDEVRIWYPEGHPKGYPQAIAAKITYSPMNNGFLAVVYPPKDSGVYYQKVFGGFDDHPSYNPAKAKAWCDGMLVTIQQTLAKGPA